MQIKFLRGMTGKYGRARRGEVMEIPDHIAQQLVKRGLAAPVQAKGKAKAGNASSRSKKSPTGGRTGKAKQ